MSPFFKYHTKDAKGVDKDGTIEASNETDAVKKLQEQGLVVISIEMTGTGKPEIVKEEVPNIPAEEKQHGTTKKCPYCAEEIKYEAVKCRYCGETLALKKFECTISKESALLLKKDMVNIGLQYTWLKGADEFDKIEIEAKDMETLMVKLEPKNIRVEAIAEIFADGQKGEVYTKCINCNKIKSIDATICPYCGKESSFVGAYVMGGMIICSAIYWLFNFNKPIWDWFWGAFIWMIIGGVGGAINGASIKSKIKKGVDIKAYRMPKFLEPIEEIRKKFSKWFISVGIFLIVLAIFIIWRSLDAFVMGITLIFIGIILICFGAYK